MNILLTNDDGVHADGLKVLVEKFSQHHKILVVAPSRERSASSHGMTVGRALYLKEYNKFKNPNVEAYSLSGKPADCTRFALSYLTHFNADIVISGINKGSNVGTDIIYSGTVSAAAEGALLGKNAVAVSSNALSGNNFSVCADFIFDNLDFFAKNSFRGCMWNVNVPSMPRQQIKGIKFAKQGIHRYTDQYLPDVDDNGETFYTLVGASLDYDDADEDCDVKFIKQNYITVTPLQYMTTNHTILDKFLNKEDICGLL